jgi:hypothetical protein
MVAPTLLLLGAVVAVSSTLFVLFKKGRREVLRDRLHWERRRFSGSKTPPRSLSPEKENNSPAPDYSDVYPPSRKIALVDMPGFAEKLGKGQGAVVLSAGKRECVPLSTELHDAKKTMCTPCDFTVEDIEALGDFPDYATLSGIPLPEPYHDFDIKKAKPRPYRPFRWAYHQTMCKSSVRAWNTLC